MAKKIQAIRGMHDILPAQSPVWQFLEDQVRAVLERYGYNELRTPLVEVTELFKRSIGEVTDIVEKEMYSFEDRGGDQLALRPEGTASCVRAAIEHSLLDQPQRIWYRGPMFRRERPQRGRYRQFHQIGVEVFGLDGPDIDLEVILLTRQLWRTLGLNDLRLEINSLGDADERAHYRDALVSYLEAHRDQLDGDSENRLTTNPLRVLDSKNPDMQSLIAGAPSLLDHLGEATRAHFETLCAGLDAAGIAYQVNPRLVRGLDYYNRTVFEWITDALGAQGTVCAGGRYDGLVAQLGGRPTPAVGFAMGLERLIELIDADRDRDRPGRLSGRRRRARPGPGPAAGGTAARTDTDAAPAVSLRRRQLQEPVQEGRPQRRARGAGARRRRARPGHDRRQAPARQWRAMQRRDR